MTGTLVNIGAVTVGTAAGLVLKSRLPRRLVETAFQAIGLFSLVLGIGMSLKMKSFMIIIFSLLLGAVCGELLSLENRMEKLADKIKSKFKNDEKHFTEGLLTAFLLFCMGSITILGAFEEGLKGNSTLLITKSVMDGFAAMALASTLGIGVGFSIFPLLLYQGGLTLLSGQLGGIFTAIMITEITAAGGILLIGLGINILEIKKIRIFNLLPALLFVILFCWCNSRFHLGL